MYDTPVSQRLANERKIGDLRTFYFPEDCVDGLTSDKCREAGSLFSGHLWELASTYSRDLRNLTTPHRNGCQKMSVFVQDSMMGEFEQLSTFLWNAGLRNLARADYGSFLIGSIRFSKELQR